MAWQSPSAVNAGGGDGNAPTGTEYTLQGKGGCCQLCRELADRVSRSYALPAAGVAQS